MLNRIAAPVTTDEQDTDAAVKRLNDERVAIVSNYDKGISAAENIAEIPPNKIDRYGFFSDDMPTATERESNTKSRKKTTRSERKWVKMMKDYDNNRTSFKFISRAYKGIPDSQRSRVWSKFLDVQTLKLSNKGMYSRMKEKGRHSSPEVRQIDLDVNRTFRLNSYFYQRYCQRQQMLFNVLTAYSSYNAEVGYCQGMNNLAAIFTMYFEEEEDVFWGLSQLMTGSKWRMHGFFVQGFPKFIRFEKYFTRIMQMQLPALFSHMESLGVTTFTYLVKWFMNCFIDVVPFSLTLRFFDVFLMEGESLLLVMAFNILSTHKDTIMKMTTIDHILDFIGVNKLASNFGGINDDKCMSDLRANHIMLHQRQLLPDINQAPIGELPRMPFAPEHALSKDEIVRRASKSNNKYFQNSNENDIENDDLDNSDAFARYSAFLTNKRTLTVASSTITATTTTTTITRTIGSAADHRSYVQSMQQKHSPHAPLVSVNKELLVSSEVVTNSSLSSLVTSDNNTYDCLQLHRLHDSVVKSKSEQTTYAEGREEGAVSNWNYDGHRHLEDLSDNDNSQQTNYENLKTVNHSRLLWPSASDRIESSTSSTATSSTTASFYDNDLDRQWAWRSSGREKSSRRDHIRPSWTASIRNRPSFRSKGAETRLKHIGSRIADAMIKGAILKQADQPPVHVITGNHKLLNDNSSYLPSHSIGIQSTLNNRRNSILNTSGSIQPGAIGINNTAVVEGDDKEKDNLFRSVAVVSPNQTRLSHFQEHSF